VDVGIVGGGWISQSIVDSVVVHGGNVVGLCDPDPSKRAHWAARGHTTYESMSELLAAARPATVFVLTPTSTHASLTIEALEAGVDVVVEKPLASSSAEARTIVDTVARLGGQVLVDESYPWMPSHRAAIAEVSANRLGRPTTIVHTFHGWQPRPERVAAVNAANATGWRATGGYPWIVDHIVHLFALSKRLCGSGRVSGVSALGGPAEGDIRGATWQCGDVDVVFVRATRGMEGPLGTARGLHTRVIGTDGYLDVLGEGGSWGDGGLRGALRFCDGTTIDVDDQPDLLWEAEVGYYPSAHRSAVAVALDFLAGEGTQPYFAVDALDDIEATEALIRSAQARG
jgi:predicted dehydrogenase